MHDHAKWFRVHRPDRFQREYKIRETILTGEVHGVEHFDDAASTDLERYRVITISSARSRIRLKPLVDTVWIAQQRLLVSDEGVDSVAAAVRQREFGKTTDEEQTTGSMTG